MRCVDGSCAAELKAALDRLEAAVRKAAPANQGEVLGLVRQMRAPLPELDAALEGTYRPGRPTFEDIVLRRELSGADAAAAWVTETAQGKPWKRQVTLAFLGPDGKPLARVDLGETGWVRYAVEGQGRRLVERLEVRVEQMELK